jgi:hypothetical protein
MYEIWQHIESRRLYLVGVQGGKAMGVRGPLRPDADPVAALEGKIGGPYNGPVVTDMVRDPRSYKREYTTGRDGRAVKLIPWPEAGSRALTWRVSAAASHSRSMPIH